MRLSFSRIFVPHSVLAAAAEEEDGSVSSTIKVTESKSDSKQQQQQQQVQQQQRRGSLKRRRPSSSSSSNSGSNSGGGRRHVRFCESANQSHDNTSWCREDVPSLWYDAREYQVFRSNRLRTAKQARSIQDIYNADPQSYRNMMLHIFGAFCQAENNNNNNMDAEMQLLIESAETLFAAWLEQQQPPPQQQQQSEQPQQQQQLLQAPIQDQHNDWLGLERILCSPIHKDRSCRRHGMMDAVLDIQEEFLCNTPEKADLIATTCQELSLPSRLLAIHLADQVQQIVSSSC